MSSPWPEQFDFDADSSEATVEIQPVPPRRERRPPRRTARRDVARGLAVLAGVARRHVTILRRDVPAVERQRRAVAAGVLAVLLVALLSTGGKAERVTPPVTTPPAAAEPLAPPPVPVEPAAASFATGTLLRKGDRGPEVRRLQESLVALQLTKAKPDGVYGKKTINAVKKFQRQAGLQADGVVGPKTAEALNRAVAGLP